MTVKIIKGDCRDLLRTLPDESVHCVISSPPYWGLRDYGTAQWEDGDPACDHLIPGEGIRQDGGRVQVDGFNGSSKLNLAVKPYRNICGKCGARRIDSQLGLEPSLGEHVQVMTEVFREVRRVLRKDGTLWLNYGDSYAASPNGRKAADIVNDDRTFRDKPFSTIGPIYDPDYPARWPEGTSGNKQNEHSGRGGRIMAGGTLKPKDLCGVPWRIAFALQADGWYLRSDIIWHKLNPMPESCTDRPTKGHEYVFLFSKSERYFYDNIAIAEECVPEVSAEPARQGQNRSLSQERKKQRNARAVEEVGGGALVTQALQAVHETQTSFEEVLRQRETDRCDQTLPVNGQGAGEPTTRHSQASSKNSSDNLRSNRGTVDDNQGPSGSQVQPLRSSETVNTGPYNPVIGRRATHGVEHSSTLPELQQSQEQKGAYRNRRTVWSIATEPFRESHFATMPSALVEPCILAGCPKQCCARCGAPWVREVERNFRPTQNPDFPKDGNKGLDATNGWGATPRGNVNVETIGFSPSCLCYANLYQAHKECVPGTVLDPFGGAGTTGLVADRLGRNAILIELNPAYAEMAERRIRDDAGLFAQVAAE